jgi:photosystem II stability/assembly factor-like uncharacterized protein
LMLSEDSGKSWRAPAGGFPENKSNVEALTICGFPSGYEIFAGNSDGEVLLSSDKGESWTRIASGLPPICKPTHDDLIAGKEYVSA